MRFNHSSGAFLILILLNFAACKAQQLTDLIKPIKVKPNVQDTLLISDIFYSTDYNISLLNNNQLSARVDNKNNKLILKPKDNISAVTLLDFELGGKTYSLPIFLEDQKNISLHTFQYKPDNEVKNISIIGSFNNWNRSTNKLTDKDGNGIFKTEIPLEPGHYTYKFNVDGEEILDPANSETEPTGFDGFNSVLKIQENKADTDYLYILEKQIIGDKILIDFFYDKGRSDFVLQNKNIIALLNNQKIQESSINIAGNKIQVELNKDDLTGEKILRLVIFNNAHRSNLQSVFFYNGDTERDEKVHTTWHDGSIYSIMIDRFDNGDKSLDQPVVHDSLFQQANYEGGDLKGIIDKIEEGYFDSLGINVFGFHQFMIIQMMHTVSLLNHIDGIQAIMVIGQLSETRSKKNSGQ